MRTFLFIVCSFLISNVYSLETTNAIKRDFNHIKTKVIPEKTAKAKKKIAEISNNINSKIQKKTTN